MLYPRALKEFAESLGEDLIVLPSSIHEVLLTPSSVSLPPEELNEMVQAIHQSDVPAEDRLSDHIYYFSRIQGCLYLPPSSTTTLYSGADGTSESTNKDGNRHLPPLSGSSGSDKNCTI